MSTPFAAQLGEIAAKSTNELDLKAQKTAHSKSIIFDKKVAALQDFDTIYQLCYEGFEDLCEIDHRFDKFRRSLFSEQSKTTERDQMTAEQNSALDTVLESCLGLLGGRLLLSPAIKVVEWLVRRFKVHQYNTSFLLLTFLPYHTTRIFCNLLSILPSVPAKFKFLGPYMTTITSPPRHAIAYGAINNDGFFNSLNDYTVRICQAGGQHQSLLSFWASITAEAVAGRLDLARSGRQEIQRQRQEDVLLKILPVLKDGLAVKRAPEMVVACYTIAIILGSKSQLADAVLDAVMKAVVHALLDETMEPGLICLSTLAQKKSNQSIPFPVLSTLSGIKDLESRLRILKTTCHVDTFALALVESAILNLRDENLRLKIEMVERILSGDLLDRRQKATAVGLLLKVVTTQQQPASQIAQDLVMGLLQRFADSKELSLLIAEAVQELGLDSATIEAKLQSLVVQQDPSSAKDVDISTESDSSFQESTPLARALERIQECSVNERSFLSRSQSDLFQPLLEGFMLASQSEEGLRIFQQLSLWEPNLTQQDPLFASFLVRVFSGPHPIHIRLTALRVTQRILSDLSNFDSQTILPYVLLQLADPVPSIRKTATQVLLEMARASPSISVNPHDVQRWAVDLLYDLASQDHQPSHLSARELSKITQKVLLPALEECVLDPDQCGRALQNAMKPSLGSDSSNSADASPSSTGLKKHVRQGLFRLILTAVDSTPLLSVKVGLLGLLGNVERVGVTWKQNELMPLLLCWATLSHEEAEKAASAERLKLVNISSILCNVVSASETNAVQTLLDLCSSTQSRRPDIVSSVAQRTVNVWQRLGTERQAAASGALLISMFGDQAKNSDRSQTARQVFQSVKLSTNGYEHLLKLALVSAASTEEDPPATKKRRDNHSQAVTLTSTSSAANVAKIRKITFILELVDSSNPEDRPELLGPLLRILASLRQLTLRDQSELSYLLSLPLGSLLSIVRHAKLHSSRLDLSAVRLDVIVDCMRETGNSQVQNTALLLIVTLASISPERVLDSIMPVFTFMGANLMGRSDEWSNFVVDHAMEKVIPPLIQSLNSQNQNLIAKTSDLVSSFVVAYEHIPSHRRLALFKRLISALGDEKFLWVILVRLTEHYEDSDDVVPFIISLVNLFDVVVQLKTYLQYVAVIEEALASENGEGSTGGEPQKACDTAPRTKPLSLLVNLERIFASSSIRSQSAGLGPSTIGQPGDVQSLWENLLKRLIYLTKIPVLADEISAAAESTLSNVLPLLPTAQFVDIAERLIEGALPTIRRKALELLDSRISERGFHNRSLHPKITSLLHTLYGEIHNSEDNGSKYAAVACVEKICRVYGRKDIPAVLHAAEVISGRHCFQSATKNDASAILHCLASLVNIAKEAIIPVVPAVLSRAFDLLRMALEDEECSDLYGVYFHLLSALLTHVPFIISEEQFDQTMIVLGESASADLSVESGVFRQQTLLFMTKNIELTMLVSSLQREWPNIAGNGISAVLQAISLFSDSVKLCSKSLVVKNASNVMTFLLQALNLRQVRFMTRVNGESDILNAERSINAAIIQVIYKLNDSTFRPVFLRLMDWAIKCPDVSSKLAMTKHRRQITLFNFLADFFGNLKSIVTSYASHMVTPAIAILEETSKTIIASETTSSPRLELKPRNRNSTDRRESLALYLSCLRALRAALRYDQDAHFSNPTLFIPLSSALTSQLQLAPHPTSLSTTATARATKTPKTSISPSKPITPPIIFTHLISTIVSLAIATLDTPDHLKSLNNQICNLRHSPISIVRKASIETHLAIIGCATYNKAVEQAKAERGNPLEVDDDYEERAGEADEARALAEEWCTTVLSVGQGMVYVNELLEDSEAEVRRAAEKLVALVREVVGDDEIFG